MDLFDSIPQIEQKEAAAALAQHHQRRQEYRRQVADIPLRRSYNQMLDSVKDWQVPELPDLSQFDEVIIDHESTGLAWWRDDEIIGTGIWTPDGVTRYLPIRHKIGPNIPIDRYKEWATRELRGKRVVNIRTKFDLHLFRKDGIDLDAQGCTFGDVAHYAALLDDHRTHFNQKDLVAAFLGSDAGKMTETDGYQLDAGRFAEYPAGLVARRAEHDVLMVAMLQKAMWPQLTEQDLHRVRVVEDGIIPVVVEMEHNGAPIDVEKLTLWCDQSERDVQHLLLEIQRMTGVLLDTPNKRDDLARMFRAINIAPPKAAEENEKGERNDSYADDLLAAIDHPVIPLVRKAISIASLRSKFLVKYLRSVSGNGILRYELHQLPYERDKKDGSGAGGAVSGRFSSAAMQYYDENGRQKKDGGNIQQVYGVKSQFNPKQDFNPTQDYIVRKLFVPDKHANPGAAWFTADMAQIEYRRFVSYSESERLIQSYKDDPMTDYHVLVHGLIVKLTGKDFERTHVKNLNFASLYGAGMLKIAFMVGEITESELLELRGIQQRHGNKVAANDPRVAKTKALYETYHSMFPEVRDLLNLASDTAKPGHDDGCKRYCTKDHRGYVMTALGRRARFRAGDRMYSALNRVIQGTAADDNKVALIDVYKERHTLGFVPRFTVHDELCGDLIDPQTLPRMKEFLNQQRLDCKVPILWASNTGPSWAESK